MIQFENHLGVIELSQRYFAQLIGNAVSCCFGVAGMANSGARQGVLALVRKNKPFPGRGVRVSKDGSGLCVELHIVIGYGLNISSITKSIVNKVRYTVEEATGLEVRKVNVFVDSVKTD